PGLEARLGIGLLAGGPDQGEGAVRRQCPRGSEGGPPQRARAVGRRALTSPPVTRDDGHRRGLTAWPHGVPADASAGTPGVAAVTVSVVPAGRDGRWTTKMLATTAPAPASCHTVRRSPATTPMVVATTGLNSDKNVTLRAPRRSM